ncbi:cytosolic protein [Bacillus pseudomycoides]|uniref:Cytosolic protein n=1 Tax=Bacillus pseudomycoides TaxID=64104 RepID=A0A2A8C9T5_9BACI|nr:EndoU domain-containing protein [Bacillus pseudomycoides]PEM71340.1 cytosolic protein [Bacillus pseudomycoides]
MSLNMYLGEVHTQTQSMNAVCTATIQGMEQVIQSIDAFAIDTVLQGQTYSSAKHYFAQTFRPLAQGIIYLCEELIRQNDAFPSQFQSQVASTDVIEQEIIEQIRGIDQTRASMEVISQAVPLPGMQAMVGIFDAMKRKLQEKLEHLHEFNYTSSSNYDTAIQLASSIARGLAEVQSGKGFSLASGTFSTQGLNMEWANSIQAIEEGRKRQADNLLYGSSIEEGAMCGPLNSGKKDESLLDKFKHGVEDAYDDYSKIKYVIDDKIESTFEKAGLGVPYHYKKGMNEAMGDELLGLADAALHPIDTFNNTIEAISDPVGTFNAIKQTISDSWNTDFVNGDLNSKAEWYGGASAHAIFAVTGTKGVDKAAKFGMLKAGTKLDEMSQAAKQGFQDTASLFNRNRNEFAFSGGNGIRFGVDTPDFRQTEEKLSTYQFANSGGRNHTPSLSNRQIMSSLRGTEKFTRRGLKHILEGEINGIGKAVGYHTEVLENTPGKIVVGTERTVNNQGVYKAKVEVNGVPKTANRGYSTFFPKDWSPQKIVDNINEAYNNKRHVTDNTYKGVGLDGIEIIMYIADNGKIISAFPKE